MVIGIVGGGAAGFFAAINCAINFPAHSIYIFEKSNKVLSKVRISGGGRCNVTNGIFDERRLAEYYPRGHKELRNAFSRFGEEQTVSWFESRGVKLKTEPDGRMFPVSNDSASIIQCLMNEVSGLNISLKLNYAVSGLIVTRDGKFELSFTNDHIMTCDRVIITAGGYANERGYDWISRTGHEIIHPVPSLFTFNIPGSPLKGLEGVSSFASIRIADFNVKSEGPVLITHWGLSGPAVLKLSAFAARWLNEKNYSAMCVINWTPQLQENEVREMLSALKNSQSRKKVISFSFHELPLRLWQRICKLSDVKDDDKYGDLSKGVMNKLTAHIHSMTLSIKGKTTFKEEFVTCGGVSLKDIDMQTMESKKCKGLFFAGEVLDIDGVTGGFNFQAAWTTGYLAGVNAGQPGNN